MMPLAVIGIGSPFGFDRLGWAVVDALRGRAREASGGWPGVRLEKNERLGAPLLAQLRSVDAAILVDALAQGPTTGQVVRLDGRTLDPADSGLSSHGFGLAQTLATGVRLDELPGQVWILGLATEEPARPPNLAEVHRLAEAVETEIARFRGTSPPRRRRPEARGLKNR
ncbi:MAG: hydrogenase maturation protease [Gammaproteobacteria bacterium]|jgi:hydrogenase maturation protease|nr:hydrogenase maturation protease [Gammaproteobacteria bacterium]